MSKQGSSIAAINPLALALMDIDNKTKLFISRVCTKYNLPKKDVENMFSSMWNKEEAHSDVASSRSENSIVSQLASLKKPDLEKRCKDLGFPFSGKSKQQLLDILSTKPEMQKKPQVPVKKNQHGNYEHPNYHFVFSCNGVIFGKQVGCKVADLSKEDIVICKKENFRYELPNSLDTVANETKKPTDEDVVTAILQKVKNANSQNEESDDDVGDDEDDEKGGE
tara:strand:+ start:2417 stop:3085 length:669 start_codon:yes stop_codon:yes gene_type:complete